MEEKTTIQQTQDAEIVDAVQAPDAVAVTVETDAGPKAAEQPQEPNKRRGRRPMTPEAKEARKRVREEAKRNWP